MFGSIERLKNEMTSHQIDAVLLVGGANRYYYSGFTGTDAIVLISQKDNFFFTDSRYTLQAGRQCPNFTVKELTGPKLTEFLQAYKADNHINRIWVDENNMTLGQYNTFCTRMPGVEFVPGAQVFSKLRMIKTPEEIKIMKEAAKSPGRPI